MNIPDRTVNDKSNEETGIDEGNCGNSVASNTAVRAARECGLYD